MALALLSLNSINAKGSGSCVSYGYTLDRPEDLQFRTAGVVHFQYTYFDLKIPAMVNGHFSGILLNTKRIVKKIECGLDITHKPVYLLTAAHNFDLKNSRDLTKEQIDATLDGANPQYTVYTITANTNDFICALDYEDVDGNATTVYRPRFNLDGQDCGLRSSINGKLPTTSSAFGMAFGGRFEGAKVVVFNSPKELDFVLIELPKFIEKSFDDFKALSLTPCRLPFGGPTLLGFEPFNLSASTAITNIHYGTTYDTYHMEDKDYACKFNISNKIKSFLNLFQYESRRNIFKGVSGSPIFVHVSNRVSGMVLEHIDGANGCAEKASFLGLNEIYPYLSKYLNPDNLNPNEWSCPSLNLKDANLRLRKK